MMTPEEVKQRVQDIRDSVSDDETAHSMEDDLYFDVLASIAAGLCSDPAKCAEEATKTAEIDFARWCA